MENKRGDLFTRIRKTGSGSISSLGVFSASLKKKKKQGSFFMQAVGAFEREAAEVERKLKRLDSLCRSTTLFKNTDSEIAEASAFIGQKVQRMGLSLERLREYSQSGKVQLLGYGDGERGVWNRTTQEHTAAIVCELQRRVGECTRRCHDVLEARTETMARQRERAAVLGGETEEFRPQTAHQEHLAIEMAAPRKQEGRSVQHIEATIKEMGSVFQHMAELVQEQGETVHRLDRNTEQMGANIAYGREQLAKYFDSISRNRRLMAKMFLVLVFLSVVLFFLKSF
ncbi:MAG: SNARE protein SED5/Syntaxin 5 [Amphiamblys sp. WSBS2006]|nr:MAG: SNARE protein SED5/Syntaxin 5 [Amphiamblys sp. WSBS2006]